MDKNKANIEQYSRSQVKRATVISYLSLAINILSGLIFTPWLIHQLGEGDYGLYSIGTSIITLLIMDFGINEAVGKYVAEYRATGREDKVHDLISLVFKIYLLLAVIFLLIFTVLYFFLNGLYDNLAAEELVKLKNIYVIIAVYNVFAFALTPLSGIMLAYEYLTSLKICDIINRLVVIAITVVAIWFGLGLYACVLANAFAGIIVILYKLIIVRRRGLLKINIQYKDKALLKSILSFSVWVAVLIITQRCIYSITPSILGALAGSAEVTRYSVAGTLEGYVYSFGSVISALFLAKISRQLADGDKEGFDALIRNTGKIQFILISVIFIGFICVGYDFINLWMGEGYEIIYYMTIILLIPSLYVWPFMTASVGLTVANKVKGPALVNLGTAMINILMEFLIVPRFGAMGAIVSIAIANTFKGIALVYVYRKYLSIKIKYFMKDIFGKYGLIFAIALSIGWFLTRRLNFVDGWIGFVLRGTLVVGVYGVVCVTAMMVYDKGFAFALKMYLRRKE